eukprot:CAMPEP_0181419368 /NCGR_PEP_ID=MMETSP1110-20121109/12036_1 /TAXON_ID=174948 /ORGANISM="Symbiodinium sp., Strain CCMP421" /LENGTH=115 /DNA_ID=CAMNT_0023542379 /DNA_START=31 /DNA_END=375 /DNA_ORIENTATION=+
MASNKHVLALQARLLAAMEASPLTALARPAASVLEGGDHVEGVAWDLLEDHHEDEGVDAPGMKQSPPSTLKGSDSHKDTLKKTLAPQRRQTVPTMKRRRARPSSFIGTFGGRSAG